jgi:hypothetical protein
MNGENLIIIQNQHTYFYLRLIQILFILIGLKFLPFVPSKQLHKDACTNFNTCNFTERYTKQIYSLNKENILQALSQFR